ncbi:uncharacterized protein LAJ45_01215 [Morchella importuna]|uniref:uncharacterized protein n=1 Tax=Morchella importuna TaxID=1174673 RepID=UPI001E8CCDA4|nr:uncharacterized protein LAJ45_01215 [Morchella importuna]KAH8154684.1 hypothetical protein LAJ45_01215 [Morchella importuna]
MKQKSRANDGSTHPHTPAGRCPQPYISEKLCTRSSSNCHVTSNLIAISMHVFAVLSITIYIRIGSLPIQIMPLASMVQGERCGNSRRSLIWGSHQPATVDNNVGGASMYEARGGH